MRRFLFLQGPHGPFFRQLGRMLRAAGAQVWRAGFNAGDRAFWFGGDGYIACDGPPDDWPATFTDIVTRHRITDIVLYGDTRPVHAQAIEIARARGLCVHVFEEGYLRPFWVTYERGGSNGHSRLMEMSIAEMRAALARTGFDIPRPPARWGDMREHVFYGALYHWFVLFRNRGYPHFRTHRELSVARETRLYTRRLMLMPLLAAERIVATQRIRASGRPYHLVLLQLEHDASFRAHSPFACMEDFIRPVIRGFAAGAPPHHLLVFKAHPLENGRAPLKALVRRIAAEHGVAARVHYVGGGKLARLLDLARSAVTVNSTAGQQVLWRGIPLRVMGRAIYAKPELVSDAALAAFFAEPGRPDTAAYRDFRRYLLETSQVPGGFYSARGRRQLLRQVVDMMLAAEDPYDALRLGHAAPRQALRVVG
ncbi:MAG: capsular biosynthesis protein [Rubellimicrobium sp.]|nr:capsular biosynthesis protein [Rubellimicrobium sp.]